jgi:hypothetical protein
VDCDVGWQEGLTEADLPAELGDEWIGCHIHSVVQSKMQIHLRCNNV